MSDFVVIGTDTDAGKTTFSVLFLSAFAEQFAYWKPVETGTSDSEEVRRLVPNVDVFPPVGRFVEPVAPPLAARREGRAMPTPAEVVKAKPCSTKPLVIETFGSPLSPFTDDELQIELLRRWNLSLVLVSSSSVGAVGRTLSCLTALRSHGLDAKAIVLVGIRDQYAEVELRKHGCVPVFTVEAPSTWTVTDIRDTAKQRLDTLTEIRDRLNIHEPPRSFLKADRQHVWHPYTSLADPIEPLSVVAAEDEFLILQDGRRIIDAVSSWWTILHGHRQPALMQALRDATNRLDHVLFAGVTHPDAVELAAMFLRSTPWPDGRVFYSDNGSTAVEVALKMCYQWWCHRDEPHRTLFVGFDDCYHGDTFGAMAVSRDATFFGRFEPFFFQAARVPVAAEALDDFLQVNAKRVAAVIIEPLVQGAGGMKMHTPAELKAIHDVAQQHGVLFIVDEVMTANRTGTIWAFEQAGIVPDLICAAKTLTGGVLPLAATLISPKIVAGFETADRTKTFFHGHSFTANPLACAVAVANWKLIESGSWKADVARIEHFWRTNLPMARVCGTIAAVDLDVPGGYLAKVGPRIREMSLANGVLLRPLGNVVYAMPPLCTSDESLAKIANVMQRANGTA